MPYQPILPTWLAVNGCNFTSPSGFTDLRTGQQVYGGGLNLGDYFDLTGAEAKQLSNTATATLYQGRYRMIQVDSAATAANIVTGAIGLLTSMALGVNDVTSYDKGLSPNLRPVVFLNAITPGNYGFIQELGDASLLAGSSVTIAAGTAVYGATGGVASNSAANILLGYSLQTATNSKLFRALLSLPVFQN